MDKLTSINSVINAFHSLNSETDLIYVSDGGIGVWRKDKDSIFTKIYYSILGRFNKNSVVKKISEIVESNKNMFFSDRTDSFLNKLKNLENRFKGISSFKKAVKTELSDESVVLIKNMMSSLSNKNHVTEEQICDESFVVNQTIGEIYVTINNNEFNKNKNNYFKINYEFFLNLGFNEESLKNFMSPISCFLFQGPSLNLDRIIIERSVHYILSQFFLQSSFTDKDEKIKKCKDFILSKVDLFLNSKKDGFSLSEILKELDINNLIKNEIRNLAEGVIERKLNEKQEINDIDRLNLINEILNEFFGEKLVSQNFKQFNEFLDKKLVHLKDRNPIDQNHDSSSLINTPEVSSSNFSNINSQFTSSVNIVPDFAQGVFDTSTTIFEEVKINIFPTPIPIIDFELKSSTNAGSAALTPAKNQLSEEIPDSSPIESLISTFNDTKDYLTSGASELSKDISNFSDKIFEGVKTSIFSTPTSEDSGLINSSSDSPTASATSIKENPSSTSSSLTESSIGDLITSSVSGWFSATVSKLSDDISATETPVIADKPQPSLIPSNNPRNNVPINLKHTHISSNKFGRDEKIVKAKKLKKKPKTNNSNVKFVSELSLPNKLTSDDAELTKNYKSDLK